MKPLLAIAVPSESALLDWLKVRVSRLMLEEISTNDWGKEVPGHFAGIETQLSGSAPFGLLPWCPREVLELERWKEPADERGHWARLLACTILLRNAVYISPKRHSDEEFFLETSAASLIQLTRSAIALNSDAPETALGFLLWLYENQTYPRLRPFAAFCALLLAAATLGFHRVSDREVFEICRWVDDEEARCRNLLGHEVESERWLIGLNGYADLEGQRGNWRAAAKQVFQQPKTRPMFRSFLERLGAD